MGAPAAAGSVTKLSVKVNPPRAQAAETPSGRPGVDATWLVCFSELWAARRGFQRRGVR